MKRECVNDMNVGTSNRTVVLANSDEIQKRKEFESIGPILQHVLLRQTSI